MKQIICNFKKNKLLKLYLILFFYINLIYTYFQVSKIMYARKYSLGGTIEKYQFEYLSNISRITNFLELLVVLIYLIYVIKVVRKKDKMNIKQFFIFNFTFFVVLTSINYLVSVVFSIPFWHLNMLSYILLATTFISLLFYTINMFYKKTVKKYLS